MKDLTLKVLSTLLLSLVFTGPLFSQTVTGSNPSHWARENRRPVKRSNHLQLRPYYSDSLPVPLKIRIWANSFIPYSQVGVALAGYGRCFAGDNRTFSDQPNTSCRTHQEIEFEVSPLKLLSQACFTGKTHRIDCKTGQNIISGQAKNDRIVTGPPALLNDRTLRVNLTLAANNPLVFAAPDIDMAVSLDFDWVASEVTLAGKHDGFPAFEIYMTVSGGQPIELYRYLPAGNTYAEYAKLLYPMDVVIRPTRHSFSQR